MDSGNELKTDFQLSHVFQHVSKLEPGNHKSKFTLQNLPWSIELKIEVLNGEKCFAVLLTCDYQDTSNWSCSIRGSLKIQNEFMDCTKVFSATERSSWFWTKFRTMTDMKKCKLIVDDTLIVEVTVVAEMPQECNFPKEIFYKYCHKAGDDLRKLSREFSDMKKMYEKQLAKLNAENKSLTNANKNLAKKIDDAKKSPPSEFKEILSTIDRCITLYNVQKTSRGEDNQATTEEPEEIRDLIKHLTDCLILFSDD